MEKHTIVVVKLPQHRFAHIRVMEGVQLITKRIGDTMPVGFLLSKETISQDSPAWLWSLEQSNPEAYYFLVLEE